MSTRPYVKIGSVLPQMPHSAPPPTMLMSPPNLNVPPSPQQPMSAPSYIAPSPQQQLSASSYIPPSPQQQLSASSYIPPSPQQQMSGSPYIPPSPQQQISAQSYIAPSPQQQMTASPYVPPSPQQAIPPPNTRLEAEPRQNMPSLVNDRPGVICPVPQPALVRRGVSSTEENIMDFLEGLENLGKYTTRQWVG